MKTEKIADLKDLKDYKNLSQETKDFLEFSDDDFIWRVGAKSDISLVFYMLSIYDLNEFLKQNKCLKKTLRKELKILIRSCKKQKINYLKY